ncbi:MAG: hypothetical protein DIU67_003185 [Actinomycetes bacterium]|jgi:hypothetical protein|nr:MAG: hypothetical protein DIU67_11590 [Actinomycetota bacterium]
MTDANETVDLEAIHRAAAPHAFNETWQYLDRDHLTPAEEEAMLSAAFAQRYHWYAVGDPRNRAIADWQVSRATVVAGYAELADRFARRSLETCLEHGLDPFVTGFAHEAIARAAAEVDDVDTFTENLEAARALLGKIEDEEERKILAADLAEMSE